MIRDGASCPGCGLPNYEGMCPVCLGDYPAYVEELEPFFGPWHQDDRQPEHTAAVPSSSGGDT